MVNHDKFAFIHWQCLFRLTYQKLKIPQNIQEESILGSKLYHIVLTPSCTRLKIEGNYIKNRPYSLSFWNPCHWNLSILVQVGQQSFAWPPQRSHYLFFYHSHVLSTLLGGVPSHHHHDMFCHNWDWVPDS